MIRNRSDSLDRTLAIPPLIRFDCPCLVDPRPEHPHVRPAKRIGAPRHWGRALFDAVFKQSYEAADLYQRFARGAEPGRLLSIDSGHPAVLAQPWELLRHPEGTWLFLANPRISTVTASTTRTDI